MSAPLKRRWFQFSLRTLLAVSFLFAVLLGWWFRPFVVETRGPDGSLRTRFVVCRDWRGGLVSHGTQTWFCADGTQFSHTNYGTPLEADQFDLLLTNEERFEPLIWLITDTIEPDSWGSSDDLNLDFGSGQTVVSSGRTGM